MFRHFDSDKKGFLSDENLVNFHKRVWLTTPKPEDIQGLKDTITKDRHVMFVPNLILLALIISLQMALQNLDLLS